MWHVQEGAYGDVPLNGLNFSLFAKWPGAIHEGNGEAAMFIDERADQRQREAISTLLKGEAGGPWGVLAWTWPKIHGTEFVSYKLEENGIQSRVKVENCFELECTTIRNPVSGAEAHPATLLPEGLIVKRADLGASKVFRVEGKLKMDHSGQYSAVGAFDYSGMNAAASA